MKKLVCGKGMYMEWNEKLQLIIDYVENHLQRRQEPIEPQEISRIAKCSFGFFQKVFSYMNGISFSEYVRSRKLTLAGYDLKSTNRQMGNCRMAALRFSYRKLPGQYSTV